MFCIIFMIVLIVWRIFRLFFGDQIPRLTKKLIGPMWHWAQYRLNLTVITMLLLVLSVLESMALGFLLYWGAETENIGDAIHRAFWDGRLLELIMRTIIDGRFGNAILYGIQTVFDVLEGNGAALRDGFPNHRIWTFSLCFSIPALTVSTVIFFVVDFLPRWLPSRSEYFIFAQVDERSIRLAESLNKPNARKKPCVIFLRSDKDKLPSESVVRLDKISARIYPYTETDLLQIHWRLKRKKIRFFFLSPDTDLNFSRMKVFLEEVENSALFRKPFWWSEEDIQRSENNSIFRQELYLLSETDSAPLLIDNLRRYLCKKEKSESGEYIRKLVFSNTDLRLLDRYRTVTYHLLNEKPLYETADNKNIRVLVLGFGRVGQAFFRTAVSFCAMTGYETMFCVCDRDIEKQWKTLLLQYPECGTGVIVERKCLNVESDEVLEYLEHHNQNRVPFTYIVLSLGDDERNIKVASRLARQYRKMSWEDERNHQPIICVNLENEIKSEYVSEFFENVHPVSAPDYNPPIPLHVFGSDFHTFSEGMLMNRSIWCAARQLHTKLKSPNFSYWTEYERRSSVACAVHASYHVKAMEEFSKEAYDIAYGNLTLKQKEAIIDAEHRRWMLYSRCEGMQGVPEKLALKYMEKIHDHVDVVARLTPCMIQTDRLQNLYETLYPNTTEDNKKRQQENKPLLRSFIERDELVVRNAGKLTQIIKNKSDDIELCDFEEGTVQGSNSQFLEDITVR